MHYLFSLKCQTIFFFYIVFWITWAKKSSAKNKTVNPGENNVKNKSDHPLAHRFFWGLLSAPEWPQNFQTFATFLPWQLFKNSKVLHTATEADVDDVAATRCWLSNCVTRTAMLSPSILHFVFLPLSLLLEAWCTYFPHHPTLFTKAGDIFFSLKFYFIWIITCIESAYLK